MENILDYILKQYELFLIILTRITGIFVISPLFSRNNIPIIAKIIFSLMLSILLLNTVETQNIQYKDIEIIVLLIREITVGVIIGFISYLFFTSLYLAGQIIDMQIGFGMVNVFDPQNNIQIPVLGNYFYIFAIYLFLLTDGHHMLIKAIISSFEILPIGSYTIGQMVTTQIVKILGQIFVIGFKISSPILAVIFISNVLLGILARTMPQMNVFVVGMPLKIIVGIAVLIIIIPFSAIALQHIFNDMYEEIFKFLQIVKEG